MGFKTRIAEFRRKKPKTFHLTITLLIIFVGVILMAIMMATKEDIRKRQYRMPIPVVSVTKADIGDVKIRISSEGTVRPLREINIVPQVGGKVVYISPSMIAGGKCSKGDVLLRIEPIDFELAVKSAEARVKDLESALQLTIEEAAASREEWEIARTGSESGAGDADIPPLVAKEPQLAAARAGLAAGRADLDKAQLLLDRTEIKAPFDGRVSNKMVDLGQYVTVGMSIGSIFSTEAAEIVLPMMDKDLQWFSVPGFTPEKIASLEKVTSDMEVTGTKASVSTQTDGSPATIYATIAGQSLTWQGRVMRTEGRLDERTRMINVVIRVDKPYETRPPLAMGLFATVEIEGTFLENAVSIPRSAVHEGSIVWIVEPEAVAGDESSGDNRPGMQNGARLRFREVKIARFEGDFALITSGIKHGELIALSTMKVVTDGMKVNYRFGFELGDEKKGPDGR